MKVEKKIFCTPHKKIYGKAHCPGTAHCHGTDHCVYTGEVNILDQRHGRGEGIWRDGSRYEGDWCLDKESGQGKWYLPSGALQYEGSFREGLKSGQGIWYNADGTQMPGFWEDGWYTSRVVHNVEQTSWQTSSGMIISPLPPVINNDATPLTPSKMDTVFWDASIDTPTSLGNDIDATPRENVIKKQKSTSKSLISIKLNSSEAGTALFF